MVKRDDQIFLKGCPSQIKNNGIKKKGISIRINFKLFVFKASAIINKIIVALRKFPMKKVFGKGTKMHTANETNPIGNIYVCPMPKPESIFTSSGCIEFVNPDQECFAFRKNVIERKRPLMIFIVLVFSRF